MLTSRLNISQRLDWATTLEPKQPSARSDAAQNKSVGRWSWQITYASGETVNDGVLDVADFSPASADKVSVLHSRGGPFTDPTMPYPERIEIQKSLGNGRVAHYNGVLVSADRIEGRYFVTGNQENHHSSKRSVSYRGLSSFEEEGTWVATQP